jgi:hypothetical protein
LSGGTHASHGHISISAPASKREFISTISGGREGSITGASTVPPEVEATTEPRSNRNQ